MWSSQWQLQESEFYQQFKDGCTNQSLCVLSNTLFYSNITKPFTCGTIVVKLAGKCTVLITLTLEMVPNCGLATQ